MVAINYRLLDDCNKCYRETEPWEKLDEFNYVVAEYKCPVCGHEWTCRWNLRLLTGGGYFYR